MTRWLRDTPPRSWFDDDTNPFVPIMTCPLCREPLVEVAEREYRCPACKIVWLLIMLYPAFGSARRPGVAKLVKKETQ